MDELMDYETYTEYYKDRDMIEHAKDGVINSQPIFDLLKGRTQFYEDYSYIPAYARKAVKFI